ncbi:MAG: hypothetical protein KR126chlam1_01011 [Chlamydiae bacterium]|nr:hypothetical protein [Chlamydiota bacterium]
MIGIISNTLFSLGQSISTFASYSVTTGSDLASLAIATLSQPFQKPRDLTHRVTSTADEISLLSLAQCKEALRKGQYENAKVIAQTALSQTTDPQMQARLILTTARAQIEQKNYDSAIKNAEKGLALKPKNPWIEENLHIELLRANFGLRKFFPVFLKASRRLKIHKKSPTRFPPDERLKRAVCMSQYNRLVEESKKNLIPLARQSLFLGSKKGS